MIDHIYQDGRHYDQLFLEANDDLPFWIEQAKTYGDPILELACGTGRITTLLTQQGFNVAGIDNSIAMLNEAEKKANSQDVTVEWVQGDIRDFELDEKFSLIILPANALCHLLTFTDFESCLAGVKKHLIDGGKFVIDVFVPNLALLIDKPDERFPFSEYNDPGGKGKVVVTHSYVYEADTQIKRINTFHSLPGEDEEVEGELNMRMYFPQELDALLKYNGFTIEQKFGNYDLSPFNLEAEKQLIICSVS
jgi:SAM-dependent methyltransferase